MTAEVIALCLVAGVSIVLPLIILLVVFIKSTGRRKGILLSFILGAGICLLFEWLIKEQGLKWLFNHANMQTFVDRSYLLYLLVIAFVGALLAIIPEYLIYTLVYKKNVSFANATMLGLGFAMAEATTLVGYQSILSAIELAKDSDLTLRSTTVELFLSSYERCILMLIHIVIAVILAYFVVSQMPVKGILIALACYVASSYIPGFFIAFSTTKYLEIYTRGTALLLVYIVLTALAVSGVVIMSAIQPLLNKDNH